MISVKSKLKKAGKQRELHRQSRIRSGFKTISLAGYTSAGKTTLFNLLTGEERKESDELFTTLSTTTRRIIIHQNPVLISDTVGFISKLPAYMIEAFKSTLEELVYADVVVVIIDSSDTKSELKRKFTSCIKTLHELGVDQDKLVFVLNKFDLVSEEEIIDKSKFLHLYGTKKWIPISAFSGENLSQLKNLINKMLIEKKQIITKKSLKTELDGIYGI
jgi:GTP-binding protein HflX